jgi:hypothetical protein
MCQAPAVATQTRRYLRIRKAEKSADSAMTASAVATTSLMAKMRRIELTEFFSLSAGRTGLSPSRPVVSKLLLERETVRLRCRSATIESARQSARNFGFAVQAHFALIMERRPSADSGAS